MTLSSQLDGLLCANNGSFLCENPAGGIFRTQGGGFTV